MLLKKLSPSALMVLSYGMGQGLFFAALAALMLLGQNKMAAWLSYSVAYISLGFQIADLGAVNVFFRLYSDRDFLRLRSMIMGRAVMCMLVGGGLAYTGYEGAKETGLEWLMWQIPFMYFVFGMSNLFLLEINNKVIFAFFNSLQWVLVVAGALADYIVGVEFFSFGVLLPLLMHACVSFFNSKKLIFIRFQFGDLKYVFSSMCGFFGVFSNSLLGQVWGRFVIGLIAASYGGGAIAAYSLARGGVTGVTMLANAWVRGGLHSLIAGSVSKSIDLFPDCVKKPVFFGLLSILVTALISFLLKDKYYFLWDFSWLMLLVPFCVVYYSASHQFYCYCKNVRYQLVLELISSGVMVFVFYVFFGSSYLCAVVLSDVAKYVSAYFLMKKILR